MSVNQIRRFRFGPVRGGFEHNEHGPGWRLVIHPFGRGAGYRAVDLPWHSNNIADGWRCRRAWIAYVPGVTVVVATKQRHVHTRKDRRLPVVSITTRANNPWLPGWWS